MTTTPPLMTSSLWKNHAAGCRTSPGEGSTTQSGKEGRAPKKVGLKRKSGDDGDGLLNLLGKLHAKTNTRLDTLATRIGYEMDLGKTRQEVFRQLCNIPGLSEVQIYDMTDIIGRDNQRLEIFMGLPEGSKPGYVRRVMEKECLIRRHEHGLFCWYYYGVEDYLVQPIFCFVAVYLMLQ